MPLRILFEIGKALLKLIYDSDNLFRVGEEDLAPVRQRHRLVPVNKLGLELFLQAFDLGRDRRLCQVEQLARLAEAHGFGDGDQCFELADIHGLSPLWLPDGAAVYLYKQGKPQLSGGHMRTCRLPELESVSRGF